LSFDTNAIYLPVCPDDFQRALPPTSTIARREGEMASSAVKRFFLQVALFDLPKPSVKL
jgi:hypothetical protein